MKNTIALLLLLISHHLFSQNIDSEKLNNYFNYIENNNLGVGSLSIFKNGKEVYTKNFGQKNIPQLTYDKNTRYQVGSVTKMITAVLIFKLIEENKLGLNDKLSEFYPEIPNSDKITIKNLLGHTSGLGSYVVKDGEVWVTEKVSDKDIMALIIKQGKTFEPGEKVAYSNTAYYLLTKILEQKHKKSFQKLVHSEIVKPLRLKNLTSFKPDQKNVFLPYHYENNSWNILKKDIDFPNVIGVGDISATPYDLNIFINNLFHNNILKKESLALMQPVPEKESWGRGMAIWDFDGIIFYGHGGDTLGSHAILIYNKEADLSIAYDTNGERIDKENFMKNVVNLLYNKEIKLPEIKDKQ
ncbi:beta-lactamase family protein [Chryseobacterium sp. Tr-659]|uniref:serine hydrolase domain-containing protein n=1 Tax=Chryseobacterium sp. Tr-659 TaxID=2608340 RepID=UPI00142129CC|nr:serine hydrolase domain-containing protein [Chryseobacterium sp. Tr-659]NIF06608.1 beta-lactamase family protein [Chryseobacterium sp. Tr-659]